MRLYFLNLPPNVLLYIAETSNQGSAEGTRSICLYCGRGSCRHQSGIGELFSDCARTSGTATVTANSATAMELKLFALRLDMDTRL